MDQGLSTPKNSKRYPLRAARPWLAYPLSPSLPLQTFKSLGVVVGNVAWDKVMAILDVDGDGELQYDELLSAVKLYQKGGWGAIEEDKRRRDSKK